MPGSVQPDEQLEWEQRAGRLAGLSAILGAVLLLASGVLSARGSEKHAFDTYLRVDDDPSLILLPNIVQALGYVCVAVALFYLARATAARRSEMAAPTRIMAVVGPVATGLAAVLLAFAIVDIANKVGALPNPPRTDDAKDDVLSDLQTGSGFYTTVFYVTLAARLALGFALVLSSLNAMRAGLLSRFLGILGIIAGVLSVLFGGASFVLAFWLIAIGLVFMNRWPSGRGPAWETVEAIPWPSAMDRQRELMEEKAALEGENADDDDDVDDADEVYEDDDEDEAEVDPDPDHADGARSHPVSKKRKKRKRR